MSRAAAFLAFLAFAVAPPSASGAAFGIEQGSVAIGAIDAEGTPDHRAGAHPDRLQIDFGLVVEDTGTSVRDFEFELPPGLSSMPDAVPHCPRETFDRGEEECPAESQVGVIAFRLSGGAESTLPIFQVEPRPGEMLAFGSVPAFDVPLTMELRPDDLGASFRASDLPESALSGGRIELWGVPADRQTGTDIPRRPYMTMPATCEPLRVVFRARSWQAGAPWHAASGSSGRLTGCADLPFEPRLDLRLTDRRADSPTGARIDLLLPQEDDPDGLATAPIANATVHLPDGLAVSPAGAAGLAVCSDAQLDLATTNDASCPAASRVGAVEVETVLLDEPLTGDVYLGQERPGERFRVFTVAAGPGATVKSVSALRVDPATGRLSTTLSGLPQLPLSRMTLRFDGGPGGLFASPPACGRFQSVAAFEAHGGASAIADLPVTIDADADGSPCPPMPRFAPSLTASASHSAAGGRTAVSLTMLRRPGEQLTRRFAVSLPRGLSTALGAVEPCASLAASVGACPPSSRMGSAVATAGAGVSTVSLPGDVHLAGPFRGAPFSLVLAFDSTTGPFSLGTMVARAAIRIHPRTGRVTVASDPLPALAGGIPVRLQAIGMTLDRQLRNPTSCGPAAFDARIESSGGMVAKARSALPIRGCRKLGFRPRFAMVLSGRSQLRRRGSPWVRVHARMRRGDTNLRAMRLAFPPSLGFRLSGLREICPRQDARRGLCSPRARVGTARARSSLLKQPLSGSIYVVRPSGDGLPDLWLSTASSGMRLDLQGRTSLRRGRLVATFRGLPDMPISALAMRFRGGKRGVLSLRRGVCRQQRPRKLISRLALAGQDGRKRRMRLRMKARCGIRP